MLANLLLPFPSNPPRLRGLPSLTKLSLLSPFPLFGVSNSACSDLKCAVGYYNPTDFTATSPGTLLAALTCNNPESIDGIVAAATTLTCQACTPMTGCATSGQACSLSPGHTHKLQCVTPDADHFLNGTNPSDGSKIKTLGGTGTYSSGILDVPILKATCSDKVGRSGIISITHARTHN